MSNLVAHAWSYKANLHEAMTDIADELNRHIGVPLEPGSRLVVENIVQIQVIRSPDGPLHALALVEVRDLEKDPDGASSGA